MKIGDLVRVTKVSGKMSASLPVGHEVVGLLSLMEKGSGLAVYGHGPMDQIVTTPIEMLNWDGDKKAYAHTKNSMWRIELLEQKEE